VCQIVLGIGTVGRSTAAMWMTRPRQKAPRTVLDRTIHGLRSQPGSECFSGRIVVSAAKKPAAKPLRWRPEIRQFEVVVNLRKEDGIRDQLVPSGAALCADAGQHARKRPEPKPSVALRLALAISRHRYDAGREGQEGRARPALVGRARSDC
jgi:hypothetical protein